MKLPVPIPGLVIRYAYLWRAEHLRGQEEGVKDRPCAIIFATQTDDGETIVTVLPVTHRPPNDMALAVEIPRSVKLRLRLDSEQSWIAVDEANRFLWPGPDLRIAPGGDVSTVAFGVLPPRLFEAVKQRFLAAVRVRRARVVLRNE